MPNSKKKILIANRGEIACRVIRTARKMGYETVAVYSEADANALHVQQADEAVYIGGSKASDSYLVIDKIIKAAKATGATLVHPGYGFLSENAKFVKALDEAGIGFIGPDAYAMECMGDKIESKKIAKAAGVTTVPGGAGSVKDAKEAAKIAEKIGFPVMVKASAGGGGKGMRVVYKKGEIKDAFETSKNEAKNSFGDDRIFVEKFIEQPRHIEIQIIADKHGNVVCLCERECSIQRNNQKVIEEAPSPFIDEKTRKKMYAEAKALAKKVKYCSAGTVELIMDKDKNFYFLEMNTRLQVEHPVTEYITGLDLVELMIRVAEGEKLPFTQKDIQAKGWAIESRVCAEDPSRNFLPSVGRLSKYIEPKSEDGSVRVDTGVYEGAEISMYYDAMISKLITYGKDRDEAIEKMIDALGNYYIGGISHNISFLETIFQMPRFKRGDLTTAFIKDEFPEGFTGTRKLGKRATNNLIAAAVFMYLKNADRLTRISGQIKNRVLNTADKVIVSVEDKPYLCEVERREDGSINVLYNGSGFANIQTSWKPGFELLRGTVNNKNIVIKVKENNMTGNFLLQYIGSDVYVTVRTPHVAELEKYMPKIERNKKNPKLAAPITGKIVRFKVEEGDEVTPGQELFVVEAMKMENIIRAEHKAIVKKIHYKDSDLVGVGETILEFEFQD